MNALHAWLIRSPGGHESGSLLLQLTALFLHQLQQTWLSWVFRSTIIRVTTGQLAYYITILMGIYCGLHCGHSMDGPTDFEETGITRIYTHKNPQLSSAPNPAFLIFMALLWRILDMSDVRLLC